MESLSGQILHNMDKEVQRKTHLTLQITEEETTSDVGKA
jgi:hypothetical protein